MSFLTWLWGKGENVCEKVNTVHGAASGADTEVPVAPPLPKPSDETEKDSPEVIPDIPNAPII
jgi:hypothetical protein